jgi:hypothetical protein
LWTTDSTTRFPAPQSQNKLPSWTWLIHTQLSHFAKLLENLHESLSPPGLTPYWDISRAEASAIFSFPSPRPRSQREYPQSWYYYVNITSRIVGTVQGDYLPFDQVYFRRGRYQSGRALSGIITPRAFCLS